MAEKRMFSKKVTDSDAFITMSSSAQALYFHLNQSADDDGFNNQIQVAMMKAHASADDLGVLLMKKFVLRFESGVIVIKHWRLHNTLRKDRYTPTSYQEEFKQLNIKENLSYTLSENSGCQLVANGLPQIREDKNRLDKINIDNIPIPDNLEIDIQENTTEEKTTKPKEAFIKYGEYNHIKLTEEQYKQLVYDYGELIVKNYITTIDEWIEMKGKSPYKNYNLAIRNWLKRDNIEKIVRFSPEQQKIMETAPVRTPEDIENMSIEELMN